MKLHRIKPKYHKNRPWSVRYVAYLPRGPALSTEPLFHCRFRPSEEAIYEGREVLRAGAVDSIIQIRLRKRYTWA